MNEKQKIIEKYFDSKESIEYTDYPSKENKIIPPAMKDLLLKNNRLIVPAEKGVENTKKDIFLNENDSKFYAYFYYQREHGIYYEEIDEFFEKHNIDKKIVIDSLKEHGIIEEEEKGIIIYKERAGEDNAFYLEKISDKIQLSLEFEKELKKMKQLKKNIDELEKKHTKIKKKLIGTEKSLIGIMGVFVSLFSIISLNLNIFGNLFNEKLELVNKIGIIFILNGVLLIVLFALLYLIRNFVYEEEEKKWILISLIVIIIVLIGFGMTFIFFTPLKYMEIILI